MSFTERRWIAVLFGLALCLTTLTQRHSAWSLEQQAQPEGSLSGRVVDQATGIPIAKAAVSLSRYRRPGDTSPPEPAAIRAAQAERGLGGAGDIPDWILYMKPGFLETKETDPDGRFSFTGLNFGEYTLAVTADRYLPQEYGQRVPGGRGRVLSARIGADLGGAEFQLVRGAIVEGTVTGMDGAGFPNALVRAFRRRSNDILNVYPDLDKEMTAVTDAQGRYRIGDLRSGDYFVAVQMPGTPGQRGGRRNVVSGVAGDVYIQTFYPGTSELEAASTVKVPPAGNVGGINLTLRPAKTVVVSGKVQRPAGDGSGQDASLPLQAEVALVPLGIRIGAVMEAFSVSTGPDGAFRFNEVFPGRYQIVAGTKEGSRNLIALREIRIQDTNVSSLTLDLQHGFDVSGRLVADGAPAGFRQEQVRMSVSSRELFPATLGGIRMNASVRVEVSAAGDFVVRDVMPGVRYGIGFTPDPAMTSFLSAARYGNGDLWRGPVVFERGDKKIEAVLAFQLPRLDVTVVDQDKPLAGITTILAPKNRRSIGAYLSAVSDGQGKATFSDFRLAAIGDFDVFAIEDVWKDAWMAAGFWEPFEGQGIPVHIEAGGAVTARVQVVKVERGIERK